MVLLGDEAAPARCSAATARAGRRRARVHGVDPDVFGIAPVEAANKALGARRHRLGRRRGGRAQRGVRLAVAGLPRGLAGARPRARSTPTAARSRSGTRSAPRARVSSAASPTSCDAAAAATASPRSASASARAWPWSWRHEQMAELAEPSEDRGRSTTRSCDTPTSSYVREPEGVHPPLDFAAATSRRAAPSQAAAGLPAADASPRSPGRRSAAIALGELDHDLTRQHDGEPIGERITVSRPRLRHRGQAAARHARRDLAGQRRRALPAPLGSLPGAARPELLRRRPLHDRRRGPLPLRHDQARALSRGATTTTPGARRTSTSR